MWGCIYCTSSWGGSTETFFCAALLLLVVGGHLRRIADNQQGGQDDAHARILDAVVAPAQEDVAIHGHLYSPQNLYMKYYVSYPLGFYMNKNTKMLPKGDIATMMMMDDPSICAVLLLM